LSKNISDIYSRVIKNDQNRNENDFYPTPPLAVWCLSMYSNIPQNVLEPAAGHGDISYELKRLGRNVTSSDLYGYKKKYVPIESGIDYLNLPKLNNVDGMVTNPPYHKDLPFKFLQKSIQEYDYTAMLLRLTFLEGIKRNTFFNLHPPSDVIIFSDRLGFSKVPSRDYYMNKQVGGMICYAWFVFDKRSRHEARLSWVLASAEYDNWRKSLTPQWYKDILNED
jgi:hypothetical protein